MKLLALNFGRVNQQTEHFLNFTLEAAKAEGAEVELIQMLKKDIGRCRGCGGCSRPFEEGKTDLPMCIFKDDFQEILEKILDADSIVVAAPVYVLAPPGQLKDLVDRMSPACDRAVAGHWQEKRVVAGEKPVDSRLLKKKYVSFISVGGCPFHHWVSFGLPGLQLFAFSLNMKVIGQVDIHGAWFGPRREECEGLCTDLGKQIMAETGKEYEDVQWYGMPGHCPACHGDIFTVFDGTTTVECPICGIQGELSIEDGEIKVSFTDKMLAHSRMNIGGLEDHFFELHVNPDTKM